MKIVKGTDTTTPRTYTTIIDGNCQYCNEEFRFDPNDGRENKYSLDGATEGNWRWLDGRKYAVCPHCGHHNETDIVSESRESQNKLKGTQDKLDELTKRFNEIEKLIKNKKGLK